MKHIVTILALAILAFVFIWAFRGLSDGLTSGLNEYKKNYITPETTIVKTNGKPDTTITIKSLPSYLK